MPEEHVLESARKHLVEFLNQTLEGLEHLFMKPYDVTGQPLVPTRYQPLFARAWAEFRKEFDLNAAENRLRKLSGEFLQKAGLYGTQLLLKLTLVKECWDYFRTKGGLETLRDLIEAIDHLLESLQVDHGLTELKDAFGLATHLPRDAA